MAKPYGSLKVFTPRRDVLVLVPWIGKRKAVNPDGVEWQTVSSNSLPTALALFQDIISNVL